MSNETQPKTLLEMVGADSGPANISDSAIVLIDCQKEYLSGALPLFGIDAAMAEVEALISAARSTGAPISMCSTKVSPAALLI